MRLPAPLSHPLFRKLLFWISVPALILAGMCFSDVSTFNECMATVPTADQHMDAAIGNCQELGSLSAMGFFVICIFALAALLALMVVHHLLRKLTGEDKTPAT